MGVESVIDAAPDLAFARSIAGYYTPGRRFNNHWHHRFIFEIVGALPFSGAQSLIYLARSARRSMSCSFGFSTHAVLDKDIGGIVKFYHFHDARSTTLSDSVERISLFQDNVRNNDGTNACTTYEGEGSLEYWAAARERQMLTHLNISYPRMFPEYLGGLSTPERRIRYHPFPNSIVEYCGQPLNRVLGEVVSQDDQVAYVSQLFQSVCALQQSRILHKDLSASNVSVDGHGKLRLIDFGTAQFLYTRAFRLGRDEFKAFKKSNDAYPYQVNDLIVGNRVFMPPETYRGVISSTYDTWSAGMLAFGIFTGEFLVPVGRRKKVYALMDIGRVDKRVIASTLASHSCDIRKFASLVDERIVDDPRIPKPYKGALRRACSPYVENRPSMFQILRALRLPTPRRPREDFLPHDHDKEFLAANGERSCLICNLAYIESMREYDYRRNEERIRPHVMQLARPEDVLEECGLGRQ